MEKRILDFIKSNTSPNLFQEDEYEKVFSVNTFYVTLVDPIYGDLRYLMTKGNKNYCIYTLDFDPPNKVVLLNDVVTSIIYELAGDIKSMALNTDLLEELMKTLEVKRSLPKNDDLDFMTTKLALIDYLNIDLKEKGD